MIIVDTNVISFLYLTGVHSSEAEQAFCKDPQWFAPLLWRSEFRNVLAGYIRKGLLTFTDAHQIMVEASQFMHGREYEVDSLRVLRLVAASTCSAYDCEFVALAQDLNAPLVTLDRQILEQFPNITIALRTFMA